ncbi:MAG: flavocytochrome C, partial [Burkholderiaceae bacterium]
MSQDFENRRGLLKAGAAGAALAATGLAGCAAVDEAPAPVKKIGRVIVIGGGYGGATAAKYI